MFNVSWNLKLFSKAIARKDGQSLRGYYEQHPDIALFAAIGCENTLNLPLKQKLAIVKKYMADHPKMWNGPMVLIIAAAFDGMCEKE